MCSKLARVEPATFVTKLTPASRALSVRLDLISTSCKVVPLELTLSRIKKNLYNRLRSTQTKTTTKNNNRCQYTEVVNWS